MNLKRMCARAKESNELIVLASIVIVSLLIGIVNSTFFSFASVVTLARSSLVTLMFALCEALVMISGGIDVSFPAIATMSMYATTIAMKSLHIESMAVGFLIAAGIGLALGVVNGLLIGTFKIAPLIATLGMSSLINGTMLATLGSGQISLIPNCMEALYKTNLFVVTGRDGLSYPMNVLILLPIACCVLFSLLLRFTMLGRSIYAIGGDRNSAECAGFHTVRIQYFVYMFVEMIAGVAGLSHAVLMRCADATTLMGSEMMVIAACVIGGVKISGGSGTVLGTVLGVVLLELVSNNLITVGISAYWQTFVVGMFIIVGTCVSFLREKRAARTISR